ncbi:HIG1 domain family member 2A, mitochondrial [Phytophthora cinnamomi]|uniref:HIG1 domain family member 2A, mitochondrial n=1 Tax=Phytophthora cinnamomi TaxID=4785 RepID=UPI003559BA8C|nr:HIG1 domain family member 2A, mitochondrial [Phytophthora cinnamomi]
MPADRDATEPPRVYAVGDFSWMEDERYGGKKSLWTRVKEDPLVPLGCAATTAVLLGGLMTFQRGQSKLGNKFMQARVVVQTATVLALAGGAALAAGEKQEKRKQNYEDRMQIKLREDK